jgi:GNAT superfamily N-acetyltransferase
MASAIQLRPPRAEEAERLTALCLRSKAVHGYDGAFMNACRHELTVRVSSELAQTVAMLDGEVAGYAEISVGHGEAELEKLFVEPAAIGKGIGRRLFEWAKAEARERGAASMSVDSDPDAAGFYRSMGAVEVGSSPSGSIPGRFLPRLRLALEAIA